MKIGVLGDLHLSLHGPSTCKTKGTFLDLQEMALQKAVDYFREQKVNAIILPGDLLDTRQAAPAVLAVLASACARLRSAKIRVLATLGQHDVLQGDVLRWKDTSALAPLITGGLIELLLSDRAEGLPVAGYGWGLPATDDLFEGVAISRQVDIAFCHASYAPEKLTTPGIHSLDDADLPETLQVLVLGDIHRFYVGEHVNGTQYLNCGPLLPMNRLQYGHWDGPMAAVLEKNEDGFWEIETTNLLPALKDEMVWVDQSSGDESREMDAPGHTFLDLSAIAEALEDQRKIAAEETPQEIVRRTAESLSTSPAAVERLLTVLEK